MKGLAFFFWGTLIMTSCFLVQIHFMLPILFLQIYTFLLGLWTAALSKAQRRLAENSVNSWLLSTKKIFSPPLSMTLSISSDSIFDALMFRWRNLTNIMISMMKVMAREGKFGFWKFTYWSFMYFNHQHKERFSQPPAAPRTLRPNILIMC